jgi:hypothetical protein
MAPCRHYNSPNESKNNISPYRVNLPQARIGRPITVIVQSIGVSSALVGDDALTAGLIPAVLAAPRGDVDDVSGGAAVAGGAFAGGAVAAAGVGGEQGEEEAEQEQGFHQKEVVEDLYYIDRSVCWIYIGRGNNGWVDGKRKEIMGWKIRQVNYAC